jgi:hypothetical protein
MEANQCWFVGLVMMALLVVGGVELNPGPAVKQEKLDQILTHVRNQEREREREQGDKKLLERHNHEIGEMKKEIKSW